MCDSVISKIESSLNAERVENIESFGLMHKMKKYAIDKPVVFKLNNTSSYIVLGELNMQFDIQKLREQIMSQMGKEQAPESVDEVKADENEEHIEEEKEEVVEEKMDISEDPNLKEEDIELIVAQAKVSREQAINALKKSNYDVVDAMVEVSK